MNWGRSKFSRKIYFDKHISELSLELTRRMLEQPCQDEWLYEHLKEYVVRLTDVVYDTTTGLKTVLNSDLFYIVIAATQVMDELPRSISFPDPEWLVFKSSLEKVAIKQSLSGLDFFQEAARQFFNAFEER